MLFIIELFIYFCITEFILYWYHRFCHEKYIDYLFWGHLEHHKIYNKVKNYSETYREPDKLIHYNFFLFLPIMIAVSVYGYFYNIDFAIFFLFYAFLTGYLHTKQHTIYNFYMGKIHEIHHKSVKSNYGILTPMYDILFGTFKNKI